MLIVGAGLSGIGAAVHLGRECPGKSVAILEAREAIGGTWDLFRYPGIRSDSDMFTLGYSFKPWRDPKALADGAAILSYVRETAREHGVERLIRFGHRVTAAEWSSADSRWTVRAATEQGDVELTASFLFMCSGYYSYAEGYTPVLPELDRFSGRVIHPQQWPSELDVDTRRVLVIGSGATAVTLVPALCELGAQVTMLQRSPSYVVSRPQGDPLADRLRNRLPEGLAYALVRTKNALAQLAFYTLSRRRPKLVRRLLRRAAARQLPPGFDMRHFEPRYDPWDQRICFVPEGDLFRVLSSGHAEIVTDRIARFTERGVLLESGRELEAEIVVTATGLNVELFGGARLAVDGVEVDSGAVVAYKGMMFSGVPNMALAVGYTNASWTLKCDLIAQYVCRLLNFMDANGYRQVTPLPPPPDQPTVPLLDLQSGYLQRAAGMIPKQGSIAPWRLHQNYLRDRRALRRAPLVDPGVRFSVGARPPHSRVAGAGSEAAPGAPTAVASPGGRAAAP